MYADGYAFVPALGIPENEDGVVTKKDGATEASTAVSQALFCGSGRTDGLTGTFAIGSKRRRKISFRQAG